MRFLIGIIILSVLFYGCVEKPITEEQIEKDKPTETIKTTTIPGGIQEETKEPEKCISNTSQDDITHISLDILKKLLNKTDEGFYFRVIAYDYYNNTVPFTGNVGLTIFSTTLWNNELIKDLVLYKKSIYVKREEASPDCSSKEIFVKFNDIKKEANYRFVQQDDQGWLRVDVKRTGSDDLYEAEYLPFKYGEDIIP